MSGKTKTEPQGSPFEALAARWDAEVTELRALAAKEGGPPPLTAQSYAFAECARALRAVTARASAPEVMHLMTIEMGAWCGAVQSGPGIFRASSQWREVTCPACNAKRVTELLALAWDMLATMGPSREALAFAVRAGRLGVTDEQGRPLAMACAPAPRDEDDPAERDDVLRTRREMAREAGDDSPGGDL